VSTDDVALRSARFRRERESQWLELESLIDRGGQRGVRALGPDDLYRLPALYRAALSSLSVARAISLDRNLLDYLESLATRAYVFVYGVRRSLGSALGDFLRNRFRTLVAAMKVWVAVAAAVFALGVACGWVLTLHDPARYDSFVSVEVAHGRTPLSTRNELRALLRGDGTVTVDDLGAFASFLFSHNARIGLLCFALGFAAGVPVLVLLFSNGASLGAMAAAHQMHGLTVEFWAWVLPHGVTELLALCLCGAAGLMVGRAMVAPGARRRLDAVAEAGRHAASVAVGCVAMFFAAALVEGFFRQLVTATSTRYAVAAASALLWGVYFIRGRVRSGATT